ncbi:MAG TPA: TauD/TfdA family dioxygenase [Polyangiaceae bacterium]|nr:TauD/TfdA family dioxygenase [Polyangiaceae bacterium]
MMDMAKDTEMSCGAPERIPVVLSGDGRGNSLLDADLRERIEQVLEGEGAVLLSGYERLGVDGFRAFAQRFGHPLVDYEFGSTPRTEVSAGIYTSTEYPAHQSIPLHNEQSYALTWPMKIWFYCDVAPSHGGETPIADSRAVYRRLKPELRRRFEDKRLMYVRNFGGGLDVSWQMAFGTDSRAAVEAYCRNNAIVCEWKSDGELRTRQVCQASARHPRTGQRVWFNQAHLFHITALAPDTREALLDCVDQEDLPRNVYYGDGSAIEDPVLDDVRAAWEAEKRKFRWSPGDVLMLDNMLCAHGREPFSGPRRIVVAMAEPYSQGR